MTGWTSLRTERLYLRAPRASDAGAMSLYAGDARVAKMTTSIPHPYLPAMAQTFIEQVNAGRHREEVWVMDATPSGGAELAGIVSFKTDLAEIGYWVGPPFWGTGLASEAVRAVCAHLLDARGLDHVDAAVFFDNPGSQRVLTRAGFTRTGETWLHSVARDVEVPAITFRLDK